MRRANIGLGWVLLTSLLLTVGAPIEAQGDRDTWSLPEDFSSVQGQNQWYHYREYAGSFLPLVWDPYVNPLGYVGNCWSPQAGGSDSPRYLHIQGKDGAVVVQPGEHANVAIGWQAPRAGAVNITATMTAVSTRTEYPSWCAGCNDGIDLYIRHNAATVAGPAFVLHGSAEFQSNTLSATVNVAVGDFVYSYVDRLKWQDEDLAYANFTISYGEIEGVWQPFQAAEHVSNRLYDLAVVSSTQAWAVGSGGTILHYQVGMGHNIGTWTRVASPTVYDLHAVDMLSANEGWAVGQEGQILHYANGAWSVAESVANVNPELSTVSKVRLHGLDMLSTSDGWAVGTGTSIFHLQGNRWQQLRVTGLALPDLHTLHDVQMLSPSDGWAVGSGGNILHYDGSRWQVVANITYNLPDTGVFVAALATDKGSYAASESATLTAEVTNSGTARTIRAAARLYNARTGGALGESTLAEALSLPTGASSQTWSFPLDQFGASLEGKRVGIELQLHDATTGTLLASRETAVSVSDQTGPCTPVGLAAHPADGQVLLTWQPCSDDDVWTYRIYWDTAADALNQWVDVPASTACHTVTGLENLKPYHFAVAAIDLAGRTGARSAAVSAMPGLRAYLPQTMR